MTTLASVRFGRSRVARLKFPVVLPWRRSRWGVFVQVKGSQRSFHPSRYLMTAALRSLTEEKVPRQDPDVGITCMRMRWQALAAVFMKLRNS